MLRVRKQEDKVGVRRLVWLYSITQNHKTKVVLLAHFTKAQLSTITQFPGFLHFSEQSVCTSLCPVSLSDIHDRQFLFYLFSSCQFLQSDTSVHHFALDLLTARLPMLSPAADFAEPRPPSPHTPTARFSPGRLPAYRPFLESKSATAICAPGLWTILNLKGC